MVFITKRQMSLDYLANIIFIRKLFSGFRFMILDIRCQQKLLQDMIEINPLYFM